ncbi:hypothetical protein [Pontibacillus sp. HMF3514]|uniref:hypothetical protein n=1 Tax=Pontibacillus sp. HMF3514 TaxID=2692425 RepID=UPI00131FAC05|nr:hypothetical protein [Pontibacillus sp. HMF3514]QHE51520.1 hypothetical protein GS400_05500 [Pontibacillus sp. HMF3514]
MLRRTLIFISFIILPSACNPSVSHTQNLSLEEVTETFNKQGLSLEDIDLPKRNVFTREYNGVTPKTYSLQNRALTIYIYQTTHDRIKGMEAFKNATAAASLESYETYTAKNVLVFHGGESESVKQTLQEVFQDIR